MHCFIRKPTYEITKDVTGDGIVWARLGMAGCQRYPLHWEVTHAVHGMDGRFTERRLAFRAFRICILEHDVPGFHTLPNFMNSVVADDVYMRWTQFGVFSSHIRYHGTNKREPWHYPAIAPIIKKWWKLTLYTYTLYYSTKPESYLKRSTSLASSDFSSP